MRPSRTSQPLSRRSVLKQGGSALAALSLLGTLAQTATAQTVASAPATPFSFAALVDRARQTAAQAYVPPEVLSAAFTDLDYDAYRTIQFNEARARWAGPEAFAVLHAYHPGWLFDSTVDLFEIIDGMAVPMDFSARDFRYGGDVEQPLNDGEVFPGVAGFRLNMPLNAPDRFDEVVTFLGASYFRALGKDNRYGLSARGLAVNTATSEAEEFPRFSAFWLTRPAPGDTAVTFYALLESESVAGAYQFTVTPGETTTIDVTSELFFRSDIEQLGIAPLTSMFLFGLNDQGPFDDYRTRVHDSEALVINTAGGETLYRVLNNPQQLANSYFSAQSPRSFGLVQRNRDFEGYLDAEAYYERRPSLIVEPVGDWGEGTVRLIEIPTDLETNDNIVAFWIPQNPYGAGSSAKVSYRLHWGMTPPGAQSDLAQITHTLAGAGGVSGVEPSADTRKFVIDFQGGLLAEPIAELLVKARTSIYGGTLVQEVLQRVDGQDATWRLVLEVAADPGAIVEMRANLAEGDRLLTETWVYQWMKN
ncbi:glucan biosynthesis protein D [Loktanella sp. 3ANDIMAR09]|uniref:glucan biosynthesis protein n=1 Tax=Loktanella sp. 3ANDIMAR09 TaxID=1225657 RepID=UPI0006F64087|nr:glucan biosynthesis protein G [Loktanella sp. 3ANDIMAR09]KQI67486.1 glucan biosynthesis protein D [Loktanella sp. 3ANDIMAR09]